MCVGVSLCVGGSEPLAAAAGRGEQPGSGSVLGH